MFRRAINIYFIPIIVFHLIILQDLTYKATSESKIYAYFEDSAIISSRVATTSSVTSPEKTPGNASGNTTAIMDVVIQQSLNLQMKIQKAIVISSKENTVERNSLVSQYTADL
ncbi:MAG: hypothetical protein KKA84_02195 [Bacteroidetes bacterium]|nr:hypothetical protein [Bacteroidota bacterium]